MPYTKKSTRKYAKSKFGGKRRKTPYKRKSYSKRSSTSNYRKNAKFSKYIKSYAETLKKTNAVPVVDQLPSVTVAGSNIYNIGFDFSNAAAAPFAFGHALDNTTLTTSVRDGKYVFWKGIQGHMRIKMNNGEDILVSTRGPVRFKCIFFRHRRMFAAPGKTFSPQEYLFLLPNGDPTGPESLVGLNQEMTPLNFFTAPYNYRHFEILKTYEFTLQAGIDIQRQASSMAAIGNLPSHKIIKFNIPINQKVRHDVNGIPTDRDLHTRLYVIAMPTGGGLQSDADNWTMDLDSVGLYTDL